MVVCRTCEVSQFIICSDRRRHDPLFFFPLSLSLNIYRISLYQSISVLFFLYFFLLSFSFLFFNCLGFFFYFLVKPEGWGWLMVVETQCSSLSFFFSFSIQFSRDSRVVCKLRLLRMVVKPEVRQKR